MNLRFPLALLGFALLPLWLSAQPKIDLQDFATGFNRPVDITHCGDSRIFVVEQRGYIWILDSLGNRLPDPFLNIDPKVNSSGNEQGLLGLAFHPNFAQNGWFYVNYIQNNSDSRVARYSVSASNPNLADPNSEVVLFDVDQPYSNHNGGCVKFGPDGMLYISFGDGGSGGDPQNNGQKKSTLLGKMLRIDVSSTTESYTVPADNPFVNDPAYKPEIWSLGLRNVWRFSFDRLTGDIWLGEVGQDAREEIDFEPANTPGRNYGWRCYEGTNTYNANGCLGASNYTPPVFEYAHSSANGCSITGGFVYRGSEYPDLYGHYVFADYCSGRWWNIRPDGNGGFTTSVLANLNAYEFSAYGEANDGRLFVAGLSSGKIFKIRELCSAFQVASVSVIEPSCDGTANGSITPNLVGTTGNVTFVWSNGATTNTLADLAPGSYTVTVTNGNGCSRTSTVELVATNTNLPAPTLQLDSGSIGGVLCSNSSVEIEVEANPFSFAYQWYRDGQPIPNGPTGPSLTVTEPGTYTAQFVNPPCVSPLSNAVEVSALGVPEVSVLAGSLVLCNSDTVLLGASAPPANDFNYQWFLGNQPIAGATGATLTVTQPGAYSVQWARPGTACESSLSNVQNVDNEVSLPFFVGFEAGTLFVGDGGGNPPFQWYLNGQPIAGATGDTYTPTVSGYYEVYFTSPNGCTYSDGLDVTVSRTQDPASVQRCTLTPNPTSGQVRLEVGLKNAATATLRLTDAQGRLLRTFSLSGTTLVQSLDLSDLPAATYFLTLELPDGRLVREVVKK